MTWVMPRDEKNAVQLLSQIVRIMEVWKLTTVYIALVLTAILVMKVVGLE